MITPQTMPTDYTTNYLLWLVKEKGCLKNSLNHLTWNQTNGLHFRSHAGSYFFVLSIVDCHYKEVPANHLIQCSPLNTSISNFAVDLFSRIAGLHGGHAQERSYSQGNCEQQKEKEISSRNPSSPQ